MEIIPIAHIYNDFPEKFGLPRQSLMAEDLISEIVMEEGYRVPDAFRGIEGFTHLWLIWGFDPLGEERTDGSWSATVRPPKLGGNERVGVFATRSPNRPNRLGMTVVKLVSLDLKDKRGPVLKVAGADLKSGTEIFDIKPYIPYADSPSGASDGFSGSYRDRRIEVAVRSEIPEGMSEERLAALVEVLELDPRPGYQHDPERIYSMSYGEFTVRFRADEDKLEVIEITER